MHQLDAAGWLLSCIHFCVYQTVQVAGVSLFLLLLFGMLLSLHQGFVEAKMLAKKFASLYYLLEDLLSPQKHYDWGLRAIKSVLVVAGSLLRAEEGQLESNVLFRALRDLNIAKILAQVCQWRSQGCSTQPPSCRHTGLLLITAYNKQLVFRGLQTPLSLAMALTAAAPFQLTLHCRIWWSSWACSMTCSLASIHHVSSPLLPHSIQWPMPLAARIQGMLLQLCYNSRCTVD